MCISSDIRILNSCISNMSNDNPDMIFFMVTINTFHSDVNLTSMGLSIARPMNNR